CGGTRRQRLAPEGAAAVCVTGMVTGGTTLSDAAVRAETTAPRELLEGELLLERRVDHAGGLLVLRIDPRNHIRERLRTIHRGPLVDGAGHQDIHITRTLKGATICVCLSGGWE